MEERSGVLIIAVPYDSGHPFLRMGADPGTLLENGLGEALRSEGRGPSLATVRHEIWSADVRHLDMVDEDLVGSKAYAVTVMDNYSRVVLSSAVTRRQDLSAYLSILYRAVERHGAPGTLVTDSGSIFLANRAKAVYAKLGVEKEEIERRQPWQSFIDTTLTVPMECPSMSSSSQRTASGVRPATRGHRRRESGRFSDGARWRTCRCV